MTDQEHYRGLCRGGERTIELTVDQEAAILRAYDWGVGALDEDERKHLDRVLSKLKDLIWP